MYCRWEPNAGLSYSEPPAEPDDNRFLHRRYAAGKNSEN